MSTSTASVSIEIFREASEIFKEASRVPIKRIAGSKPTIEATDLRSRMKRAISHVGLNRERDLYKDFENREKADLHVTLSRLKKQSTRDRLRVTIGLVVIGALLLLFFQATGIVQATIVTWSDNVPPTQIWPLLSQLGPPLMLLALRPTDASSIRLAAALLCILCFYFFVMLVLDQRNDAEVRVRSVILLIVEIVWGSHFLRACIQPRWQPTPSRLRPLSSRQALDWLWFGWRGSIGCFCITDIAVALAVFIQQAVTGTVVWVEATAEPETEPSAEEPTAEPSSEPSSEPSGEPSSGLSSPEPEAESEPSPEVGGGTTTTAVLPEPPPTPEPTEAVPLPEPALTLASPGPTILTVLIGNILLLLLVLLLHKSNRRKVHRLLQRWDHNGMSQSAATVAAMCGGIDAKGAIAFAQKSFRRLPFDALYKEDLEFARVEARQRQESNSTLADASLPAVFGEVDAFVSHGWADDYLCRYDALKQWAVAYSVEHKGGKLPDIWFDKACLNLKLEESLKCLPVFLTGCTHLVVLAGDQYTTRLWCVLEVFTFLRIGSSIDMMVILPLIYTDKDDGKEQDNNQMAARLEAESRVQRQFATFDVNHAQCYAADRDKLLSLIEAGFSDLTRFNQLCAQSLLAALQRERRKRDASVLVVQSAARAMLHTKRLMQGRESPELDHEKRAMGRAMGEVRKHNKRGSIEESRETSNTKRVGLA